MHKHHIIPRHMGGSNDPSNLVELTVEEHALAHKELYEKHGKWQDLIAWQMLSGQIKSDDARRELCRARMLNENPMKNPETVNKAQQSRKGYRPSKETKLRTSLSMKGVKKSTTENMNKDKANTYRVVDPNNNEYIVHNLAPFCEEHGLTAALMYKVASGNRKHHRRWTCVKLDK